MVTRRGPSPWRRLLLRGAGAVILGALLWFAVEGGEYGTRALFAQHARRQKLESEVAALRHDVDSLQKEKTAILRSDAVLERIAREQYGMLRGSKEVLFWMNNTRPVDSTRAHSDTLVADR